MNYTLISLPLKFIIGITTRTSNATAAQDIPKLWQQFYQTNVAQRIAHKKSDAILALYCDYEKDHTAPYTLIIGCEVDSTDNIPQDMAVKEIPASTYVVFKNYGPFPEELVKTWHMIWQAPLDRSYTGDFELYNPTFHPIENPELDVYIAIRNQK